MEQPLHYSYLEEFIEGQKYKFRYRGKEINTTCVGSNIKGVYMFDREEPKGMWKRTFIEKDRVLVGITIEKIKHDNKSQ